MGKSLRTTIRGSCEGSAPLTREEIQPIAVKVETYGTIRDLVKESQMEVVLADRRGASVRDVLERLTERLGPEFGGRLYAEPGRLGSVKIYLDGRSVRNLDELLPEDGGQPLVRLIFLAVMGGG
jgi:hypothetical protein